MANKRLAAAYDRALALEKAGRREEAAAAWRAVLALDPADRGGAAVRLASLGAAPPPGRAPEAYVRMLFDQHAERFDDTLVERLGYRVPWLMRGLVEREAPGWRGRLLDLGCGTGLVGLAFADLASHATGVDLAEAMLGICDDRGVYDELYAAEAVAFLEAAGEDGDPPWDLAAAADMLPYLGDLEPLFAGVAASLAPGGLWLFSTESREGAPGGYAVETQRYRHDPAYVRAALGGAGFSVVAAEPITVRHEEGAPVPGELVLARLPGPSERLESRK